MKKLGLASFAVAMLVALTARGGDDAAQKKEKAALQGLWKVVSFETAKGKDANIEGATLEFDKEGKNITFTKDGETKKGTFTLNPGGKPKEIDLKPGDENKTLEGIYQIEKTMLKICLSPEAGEGRPTEFAVKEDKKFVLIKLERAK